MKRTDMVAIAGIILGIAFSVVFFKSLVDEENERWNRRQADYLKVTQGVPQKNAL